MRCRHGRRFVHVVGVRPRPTSSPRPGPAGCWRRPRSSPRTELNSVAHPQLPPAVPRGTVWWTGVYLKCDDMAFGGKCISTGVGRYRVALETCKQSGYLSVTVYWVAVGRPTQTPAACDRHTMIIGTLVPAFWRAIVGRSGVYTTTVPRHLSLKMK